MKTLVTFWTKTGNTVKVAEAIYRKISCEKSLIPVSQVSSVDEYDLIFLGFPIMQFGVPRPVTQFIRHFLNGKPVALFVTHAIISNSSDLIQRTMLVKELEKCREACIQTDLRGLFHCQGELSEQMAAEMIKTGIPTLAGFAQMRQLTVGHPDPDELDRAADFAWEICLSFSPG